MTAPAFVARVSRLKLIGLALLGVLMTALSAFVALDPAFASRPTAQLAGWAGIFFFALCVVVALRQLLRKGAVMEIGPQGLMWRRWSEETIPWTAFSRAEAIEIRRQKMLSLWLCDPEAYRSSTLLGRLAGANKALGFGDISLTAQGTDRSFDEMARAVFDHAPHLFSA